MKNFHKDPDLLEKKLIAYLQAECKDPDLGFHSPLTQLQGGYETSIYRFQLKGARGKLANSLVLRLYPPSYGSHNARWESTVQNALAGEGYPVAQAHFVCTDLSILGGAFFIMDYIPGQLLMYAPPETVPGLLGKTHAALHNIDPAPLIRSLEEQGVDKNRYNLNSRFDWMKKMASQLPWIREGVSWLIHNLPPEPQHLAVCHGDFHALNILIQEGEVAGVLDWPGFAVADPVFDVANTIMLTTIPTRHLTASMDGFSSVDWDHAAALYLSAYQTSRQLDSTNLEYYRVRRCLMALIEGFEGHQVWGHPMIREDLIGYIQRSTGVQIAIPA